MTIDVPDGMQALVERLLAFIDQDGCTDAQFDATAAALFAFQYAHNEPYRRFCQRRGVTPRRVNGWRDIPPVPIGAFKDATLSCVPPQTCERVFMTSGSTRGDVRGRNHHPTIAVWDRSMLRHFTQHFMEGSRARMPMFVLFPDERHLPHSSLARYLSLAVREFGASGSAHCIGPEGLDIGGVHAALEGAVRAGKPIALLGASYSFVHLLDALDQRGCRYELPQGSRILDTGGYKGQSRALEPQDFYVALTRAFGVPADHCMNMYGLTELSSQFYDAGNAVLPSVKRAPHWVRSRVIDPLSGRDVPAGERGLLVHCDLANFNSASTILTEDVGVMVDGGFHLLGRARGAQAKGCSLAVEEFLEAASK